MKHITLSISENVHKEMKKHPEINWSEIARSSIKEYTELLGEKTTTKNLRKFFSANALELLRRTGASKSKNFYNEVRKREWSRLKSLTRTS